MYNKEETCPWWCEQEDVGISGGFLECATMKEFANYLMNGNDLVTEDNRRSEPDHEFLVLQCFQAISAVLDL